VVDAVTSAPEPITRFIDDLIDNCTRLC